MSSEKNRARRETDPDIPRLAPSEMNTEAARLLVSSIVEQAVHDAKAFCWAGLIRNGKLNDNAWVLVKTKNRAGNVMTEWVLRNPRTRIRLPKTSGIKWTRHEVVDLLHSFQKGGALDMWLSLADIGVSGEVLRKMLLDLSTPQKNNRTLYDKVIDGDNGNVETARQLQQDQP